MTQLTLFDVRAEAAASPRDERLSLSALEDYALLYTATSTGTNSGIRFMMTLDDARRWCSSPESSGVLYGTEWAYYFTSVARFLNRGDVYGHLDVLDLRNTADNGTWDERIAAAGCVKISLHEIPAVLRPLGVTVLTTASPGTGDIE